MKPTEQDLEIAALLAEQLAMFAAYHEDLIKLLSTDGCGFNCESPNGVFNFCVCINKQQKVEKEEKCEKILRKDWLKMKANYNLRRMKKDSKF